MKKFKKLITLILTLTMLASLAVMFTPAANAASGNNRTGAYATTAPTIDGKIDTIWATSDKHLLINTTTDYIKVLWTENALYMLGYTENATSMTFIVSEMWQAAAGWMLWTQTGGQCDGNYAVKISLSNSAVTTSYPWYARNPGHTPHTDATYAAKTLENGTCFEAYFPMRTTASSFGKYGDSNKNKVGIAAFAGTDEAKHSGIRVSGANTTEGYCYKPYGMNSLTLVSNPGLPQKAGTTVEMHGAQSNYQEGDTSYDIRLVAEIAGLDGYSEAGFDIAVSYGTEGNMTDAGVQEKVTKRAYTSVLAANKKVSPTKGDNYIIALEVAGVLIKDDIQIVTLTVKPFTKNAEGVKSYGAEQTYTFVCGE